MDTIFINIQLEPIRCVPQKLSAALLAPGGPWLSLIPQFHNGSEASGFGGFGKQLVRESKLSMFSWVAGWTTLNVQPLKAAFELGER